MHDFLLVFEFEWSKVRYILNQIQGNFFFDISKRICCIIVVIIVK